MKRILISTALMLALVGCHNPDDQTITIGAGSDAYTIALDDNNVVLDVLANDSSEPQPVTITEVTSAELGAVAIAPDGLSLTYDAPLAGTVDRFQYTITGGDGFPATASVTITLVKSPDAIDDTATAIEADAVNVFVLDNDEAPLTPPLSIESFTQPTSGSASVALNDNGTPTDTSDDFLIYTADAGFVPVADMSATDTFTYTIQDDDPDTGSDTATVTVTVFKAPNAVDDELPEMFKSGRGAPIVIADLLSNDVAGGSGTTTLAYDSYDDSGLSVPLIVDDQGTPNESSDDILRYTAPADTSIATETFTYNIRTSDGSVATATVTISLADQPACSEQLEKRKNSGLGWCYETYLDSFDGATAADTTAGTNIAMQVFVPHPWHQRQNALATGIDLAADETPYSPLLVHSHGFGGNKQEDFNDAGTFLDNQIARDAWHDGYNVISYTQRGFGGGAPPDNIASEAPIGIMSPNLEGFDFIRVVDWAICHLRADSNLANALAVDGNSTPEDPIHDPENAGDCTDGDIEGSMLLTDAGERLTTFGSVGDADNVALATTGYSYGGGFQFLAQSVDERVDAIIPMGTWHDLRYSLHPNGTPKYTWITVMTQFSSPTPPLGGGNGEALPGVLTDAQSEAIGLNEAPEDAPHQKRTQVSVANSRILGPKGPVAWCDGNDTNYFQPKYITTDTAPRLADDDEDSDGAAVCATDGNADPECEHNIVSNTAPAHYVPGRKPQANIFMIQGYGDTLFNMNEGFDNARCFNEASVADVRFLAQISGHPSPTQDGVIPPDAIPPHYAGQNMGMYLDEIVHCGVDGDGQPVRYNTVEAGKQFIDFHLRGGLLADGVASGDDIFPKACITQTNADTEFVLNEADPFYNGENSDTTGYQWSREGVVFDSVSDVAVGASQNSDVATQVLDIPETQVLTGSPLSPVETPALVYTASNSLGEVLAGIPLVHLDVTRTNPASDEIFFVGTYVKRCQLNPPNEPPYAQSAADCDDGNPEELLHFQVSPVRVFPAAAAAGVEPPLTAEYPQADPRNFDGDAVNGAFYPVVWGDNPPTMERSGGSVRVETSLAEPNGRIPGVSARLYPFDQVGIMFMNAHYMYLNMATDGGGSVTVTGSVSLPLVSGAPDIPLTPPASYVNTVAP